MGTVGSGGTSKKVWADVFVDYRWLLIGLVAAMTLVWSVFVPRLQMEPSLKSLLVTTSDAYFEYEKFLGVFGDEDYIIVAIKNEKGARDPSVLAALQSITEQISRFDKVTEIMSLANLKVFRKKGDQFGSFPIIGTEEGTLRLPEKTELEGMRKALPIMDLLLSPDLKTVGILVRIDDKWKFDVPVVRDLLERMQAIVKKSAVDGSESRVIGAAVLRQAILGYSIQTALIFGILCTIICTCVTLYVFKSVKVTIVTILILGLCVLWELGLMSMLRIPLNASTSISFGLILITSLEIVIHMVARFNQFRSLVPDREQAVKETVRYLARPCFISAATTAAGFGSCMVTNIPMVFQLGLIMSLGVTISFFLAMILTPSVLLTFKSLDVQVQQDQADDAVSRTLRKVSGLIAGHYRVITVTGVVIAVVMFAGAPFIRTDPQILRQLGESRPEVKDINFVTDNLTSIHSLQLVLEAKEDDKAFKKPETWQKVKEVERRLGLIPEVVATDSLLTFWEYMNGIISGDASHGGDEIFAKSGAFSQVLLLTSLGSDGKKLIRSHLDEDFGKLRVSVRIKNSPNIPILDTIEQVRKAADSVMGDVANAAVTGEAVVVAAQGDELIKSEIQSMFIAIVIIAVLMMIQMGSVLFGLLSLVPNIPPLATVFGIMGWLRIPLDGVTVFAATVAIGLAVDNTIQFVAQLKREIKLNPNLGVEECMFRAYALASKPMASWSLVTLLGFLALVVTPFQAAVYFGLLVSSAIAMAIFGDLMFMQSIILTFPGVRKLIRALIDKEIAKQKLREAL